MFGTIDVCGNYDFLFLWRHAVEFTEVSQSPRDLMEMDGKKHRTDEKVTPLALSWKEQV